MSKVLRVQHVSLPMPIDGNDDARAFYGNILGLPEIVPPSTLNRERLVWFKLGDDGDELHLFADETDGPNSPRQHLCLQVDDVKAFQQQVEAAGVEILGEPEIHNRPRFSLRDPFQNRMEITQITGDFADASA